MTLSDPGWLDLSSIYNADNNRVTASDDLANKGKVVDKLITTSSSWRTYGRYGAYWQIDLGNMYNINSIGVAGFTNRGMKLYSSTDGISFTDRGPLQIVGGWQVTDGCDVNSQACFGITNFASFPAKYVKIAHVDCPDPFVPPPLGIYEIELYKARASATHTTAPTQIDGGENFWQWETFTDSKTTPANTSVTYRYRSSTDGATWTSWVGAIGSVTSRTGDDSNNPTKYRYLQVEATLSNTDEDSTPTIDSYSIGYHTNQKPSAPTAQTAVIQ